MIPDSYILLSVQLRLHRELCESCTGMVTANLFFLLLSLSTTPQTITHVWQSENKTGWAENTLTIPLTPQLGVWIPSFTSFIRVSIAHCCCQQRHSRFNPTPSTTLKLITCHKLTAIRCLSKTFVLSTLWPRSLADSTMYHSKSWRENCRVRLCIHVGSFYARARISRSHDMPVQLTSCSQVHNSTAFTTSHVMHPPASCLNVWKCFFPPTIPCLCVLRLKCLNGGKHQKAILV